MSKKDKRQTRGTLYFDSSTLWFIYSSSSFRISILQKGTLTSEYNFISSMEDKIFNISNNTLFIIRSFESNKRQRSINSIDQCTQSLLEKQKNRIIPFFANEWKIHRFQFSRTRKMRQKFIRISREKNPSIKLNLARIVIEPLRFFHSRFPLIMRVPQAWWNSVQTARRIFILPPKVVKGTATSSVPR